MRGLEGDLGTMSLAELVSHLAGRKASGTLSISSGEVSKQVTLSGGEILNARSNLPREYLGQFLINAGLLSEDQFHKAYETQRETQVYLGKILSMIGLVSEAQVAEALALKFRETLLSAFEWSEGEFRFVPGPGQAELEGLDVRVGLDEILREGEFRLTAWQAIRAVFPRGDLRLALHPEKLSEPIKPGSVDAQLMEMIGDGLTIDEMALALHATDFFLYQRLYAFYHLEVISIREEAPAPAPKPGAVLLGLEPTPEEMAETARTLLAEGNAVDAEALASRAAELSPTPERLALKQAAQLQLLAALRQQLFMADAVPRLALPFHELARMSLTAHQRYLLSRIDGARTIRAIVQSSPVPELDALRAFRDFIQGRLVAVGPARQAVSG